VQARGWATHKDAAGFTVEHPAGWKVTADGKSGRAYVQGTRGEQVIVWPVFVPQPVDARAAPAVLQKLTASLGGALEWEAPRPTGGAAVRMTGRSGGRAAVSTFTWVNSAKGSAGYLYVTAAPEGGYREAEEAFARILGSFRVTGVAAEGQAPAVQYVRWQDPRENAFSLEVPQGWQMSGGLFRFASVDIRGAWEAVSPDGEIRITGGDPELPPFTEPTPTLAMTGFREGSWYSPGYGVRMMVRRYVPGMFFAREYVMSRTARGCPEVSITDNRDRPDAVKGINAVYGQYGAFGVSLQLSAGEAAFTCRMNGKPARGYYFAATQRTQTAGMQGGVWNAEYLFGYVATEARAALAQSALDHMLKSVQVNPQWAAMQQNITANTSAIVSRTHNEISNIISSTYWNRQGVMDELSRRRSNVILGVEDVIDPVTGREMKVESGSNYYWIDHRGTIVGTDTHTLPNLDFREMIRLP